MAQPADNAPAGFVSGWSAGFSLGFGPFTSTSPPPPPPPQPPIPRGPPPFRHPSNALFFVQFNPTEYTLASLPANAIFGKYIKVVDAQQGPGVCIGDWDFPFGPYWRDLKTGLPVA